MGCCQGRTEDLASGIKADLTYSFKDTIQKKGDFYSQYEYVKELGQGAFGKVVEVRHKMSGLHRAAKIISSKSISAAEKTRALGEIEILKSLDHPNIMNIYEYYEDDEHLFIIGEIYRGGELLDRMTSGNLHSESTIAKIMKQILSATFHCHQKNIIHRDLKPQNILFEDEKENATVKVVDFGISAHVEPGKMINQATGTPLFMAPEVFKGSYNEKCDIWSCGVILYALLSGHFPFKGRTKQEMMTKIFSGSFDLGGTEWDGVSPEAKTFLKNLLCYNPKKRYSAEQALRDPWIIKKTAENAASDKLAVEALQNLKAFRAEKKLQQMFWVFLSFHFSKQDEKNKFLKVFQELDKNGDGTLSTEEIVKGYEQVSKFSAVPINIQEIIRSVDTNQNGQIDYTEFMIATMERKSLLQEERLHQAFDTFDKDKNGQLTIDEIKELFGPNEHQPLNDQDWKKLIREVDSNKDGQISYAEFKDLMVKFARDQFSSETKPTQN